MDEDHHYPQTPRHGFDINKEERFASETEKKDKVIYYDIRKMMKIIKDDPNYSPVVVPIALLKHNLEIPSWIDEYSGRPLTALQVIEQPLLHPTHYERIIQSDLTFPIFIRRPALNRDDICVVNGVHRLAKKCYILKDTEIDVQFMPDLLMEQTLLFEEKLYANASHDSYDRTLMFLTLQQEGYD